MIDTEIRIGEKRFFDNNVFSRGFGKSGDFTVEEDYLLSSYGQTLLALEKSDISPINSEERHFIKVLQNPGKAKTKLERTWLKYIRLARGRKNFHTLNGRSKHYEIYEKSYSDDLEQTYE